MYLNFKRISNEATGIHKRNFFITYLTFLLILDSKQTHTKIQKSCGHLNL